MSYGQKMYHEDRNQFFNGNTFIIRILCHKDIRRCMNGDRVYAIEECVRETFSDGRIGTTGSTRLLNSIPISAKSSDYSGVEICITFKDVNKGVI